MQVTYTSLINFISGEKIFSIPVYQRNYDWRKEHCEQLFKDIEKIADAGKETTHFIGTVIFQKKNDADVNHVIVDGQQRLTSVILLAKAIYDSADDERFKTKIRGIFIDNAIDDATYSFKLKPSEYDQEVFEKIMTGKNLDEHEKFSQLYRNYEFFKSQIAASKYRENLQEIRSAISRLQIVAMGLEKEKAQEIFESLNSTGKDLTETELIRNFLLMNLDYDTQERLYKEYWLKMERLLQNSETVDKFVLHYLIYKRRSNKDMRNGKNIRNSTNTMYETFKRYFRKNYGEDDKTQQVEKFLQDLLHYAKFYHRLLFTGDTKFDELSALDKKFYELIYILKASTTPILLMYLNERYTRGDFDAATFLDIADAMISCKCRAKVCNVTGFDDEQTNGNIAKRLDVLKKLSVDSFWKAVTESRKNNRTPGDEDFRQALMSPELNVSLKNFCKYLLYSFEHNINHAYNFAGYDDLSVELVVPKKLNAAWEKYLRAENDLTAGILANALGNLVLVNKDKKTGKAAFNDKRVTYAQSPFSYTSEFKDISNWNSRQIQSRSRKLANLALKIWNLPEKYQPATFNFYNLDSDFNELTNTSPGSLTISDKKISLTYWIDLLRTVSKELYALDNDNFRQAVHDSGREKIFSTSSENLTAPFRLDENYYVGAGRDVKAILKIAKDIVEHFDRLAGTNFKDEIEFTRK